MKLRTELALIALVFALVVGLCFNCRAQCYYDAWGNKICPQSQNYQPQWVSPSPGYQGGPCPPVQSPSRVSQGTKPSIVNGKPRCPNWDDKFVVITKTWASDGMFEGTGIHIHTDGTRSYILTVNHGTTGSVVAFTADGRAFKMTKLGSDPNADVSIFRTAALNMPTMPVAEEDAKVGSTVAVGGFAPGHYWAKTGLRVTKYSNSNAGWVNYPVRQGDSGGPVVQNNVVVGVIGATDDRELCFAPVGPIRRLMARIGLRVESRKTQPLQPLQPIPQQDCADCPTCRPGNCIEKFKQILDRMEQQDSTQGELQIRLKNLEIALEKCSAKVGPTGPQGPKGERGPQGLRGPQGERGLAGKDGEDGKDADTTALELRISQLEAALQKEQERTVTLEVYKNKQLSSVSKGRHTVRLNLDELE